jgi:hypothetical protein
MAPPSPPDSMDKLRTALNPDVFEGVRSFWFEDMDDARLIHPLDKDKERWFKSGSKLDSLCECVGMNFNAAKMIKELNCK